MFTFKNEDCVVQLSEIRFHIPANEAAGDVDPVEAFKESVLKKASIMTTSGDAIAILREVSCLSPRGKYFEFEGDISISNLLNYDGTLLIAI